MPCCLISAWADRLADKRGRRRTWYSLCMYERKRACEFYDTYGAWEWSRLEATPYGRLQATMHNDFIHAYFRPDARVLDVGCGPGRFSRTASLLGGRVVALDLSVR